MCGVEGSFLSKTTPQPRGEVDCSRYIYSFSLRRVELLAVVLLLAKTRGQHLHAVLSDQHSVFELRRAFPVCGDCSPVVGPQAIPPGAHADHRLDGEDMPGAHHTHRLVLAVVRDVW
jgi:hypothetical protein